ncbi:MAG: hypothetical protein M0Q12_03535 [Synergistaceae bacterium]|jgi:tetratricopeptide (TPR) repeat protein|nr:hypothetical protein [Synergistaceae bacterium]
MKKCTKCNISYTDDKKFCKKCGSSLSQEYNIDPRSLAKKTVYEDKLKEDSLNTDLLLEYSQFLYNNLLFKEAVPNLLKILAIIENQKQANELLFKCYLKLSMYSDARDVGKQLLENNTTDMFLLEKLADIETQLDNKSKAIEYYETILKLQPKNTKALYSKAKISLENNELEKAINIIKELYKEGDRDRITIIYAGIDKCLSGNYEEAVEILTPCLSEKDIYFSNLNNQRGFIYLIYSLCKTKTPIYKIDEWFSCLDFDLLKNFMQPKDEEILAKSILEIMYIYFTRDKQYISPDKIDYVTYKYINKSSSCFTTHTNEILSEIWAYISELQTGFGLLSDAQNSLKKATELSPNNSEYANRLSEVDALYKKNEKQKKRKAVIISGSVLVILLVTILSVIFFKRHKENKAWENAKQQNTVESYSNYLKNYPDNRFSEEAANLQEEVSWESAKQQNTVESYDEYLVKFPVGKYVTDAIDLKESVIWEGALIENTPTSYENYLSLYPHGKYIVEFKIEDKESEVYGIHRYVGQVKDGKREGIGVAIIETNKESLNGTYSGNWKNDNAHGYGVKTWVSGNKYEGEWLNGSQHGYGVKTWVNGDKYEGEWLNGSRHGYGVYTWLDADIYEGGWKNGLKHGDCKYYDKSSKRWYYGTLENGKGTLNNGDYKIYFE